MNHPHVKGGGTLFMQAHIHEDLQLQPGMKFSEEKSNDKRERPQIFN